MGLSLLFLGCSSSNSATPAASSLATRSADAHSASTQETVVSQQPQVIQGQMLPISAQIEIADQLIQLEVAQTVQQQAIGLMHRTELADDRGMLFPFTPPRPVNFWMKNVLISLDMIFLKAGEVEAIANNVPPCTTPICPTYGPSDEIDQVVELRGGRATELGIQVGDRIKVQFLDTKIGTAH
ncbi:MAG: DUF192 domain-containing protein [Cyanothece sp. SIO1E1]|nr:DUF192 domain-containing protein [Cyanothece sp. SIO1E1]